jgi:hypothetical protein
MTSGSSSSSFCRIFPGEERDALEQALDVGIAPALGEERRDGRVRRGELLPQLAQVLSARPGSTC